MEKSCIVAHTICDYEWLFIRFFFHVPCCFTPLHHPLISITISYSMGKGGEHNIVVVHLYSMWNENILIFTLRATESSDFFFQFYSSPWSCRTKQWRSSIHCEISQVSFVRFSSWYEFQRILSSSSRVLTKRQMMHFCLFILIFISFSEKSCIIFREASIKCANEYLLFSLKMRKLKIYAYTILFSWCWILCCVFCCSHSFCFLFSSCFHISNYSHSLLGFMWDVFTSAIVCMSCTSADHQLYMASRRHSLPSSCREGKSVKLKL